MIQRLGLLAALLAAPALALGQTTTAAGTITIAESSGQQSPPTVNIDECQGSTADNLTFTFTASALTTGATYRLQASDQASCPSTISGNSAHTVDVASSISSSTPTVTYPAAGSAAVGVTSLVSNLGISCTGSATAIYFCLTQVGTDPAIATNILASGTLTLDLLRPAPPAVNAPTAGESALTVSWSTGSASDAGTAGTATSYDVEVTAAADPSDKHTTSVTGSLSARVGGLANGTLYDVVVYARTAGGNRSDASQAVQGTPVQVTDFWRGYKDAGGRDKGGCGAGAGGLLALAALLPFLRRSRRERS